MRTGMLEFRDTFELMPQSLATLANDMKTAHRKVEPIYTRMVQKDGRAYPKLHRVTFKNMYVRDWNDPRNLSLRLHMILYCRMDVTVLREVHEKFIHSLGESIPTKIKNDIPVTFSEHDVKETISATALHIF